MKVFRREALGSLGFALALAGLAGAASPAAARSYDDDGIRSGMVFTSSNAQAGNELLVYARAQDGTLTLHTRSSTGGQGSGAGLASQGAVTLSGDGRFVFVVNAQSNSVSTFALRERDLQLASVVSSGGLHPISVTEHDGIVYVLNDAGEGNVAGFRNVGGELRPIGGSVRGLSVAGGAGPAQVGFSDDGDALVVTEKNTNRLTSYPVRPDGGIDAPIVAPSPGQTPFGFAFDRRNRLLVTEAVGGAPGASTVSSYRFSQADPARPVVASASVPDTQSSVCWIAITPNGRYAYVANTGSGSVSSYRIASTGQIELAQAVGGRTGVGSAPADSAISADGRHLFVRNGGTLTISSFAIEHDGGLVVEPLATGLPTAAVGLAAN
jgi:6-phosphogluconolactonase